MSKAFKILHQIWERNCIIIVKYCHTVKSLSNILRRLNIPKHEKMCDIVNSMRYNDDWNLQIDLIVIRICHYENYFFADKVQII